MKGIELSGIMCFDENVKHTQTLKINSMSNSAKYFKSNFGSIVKLGVNQDTEGFVLSITVNSDASIEYDPSDLPFTPWGGEWKECKENDFVNAYNEAMNPFRDFMSTAVRNY